MIGRGRGMSGADAAQAPVTATTARTPSLTRVFDPRRLNRAARGREGVVPREIFNLDTVGSLFRIGVTSNKRDTG